MVYNESAQANLRLLRIMDFVQVDQYAALL